ncbi:MAG TPA: DUF4326 domain-containing protein, partial [Acetobacteraceae bacterium]
ARAEPIAAPPFPCVTRPVPNAVYIDRPSIWGNPFVIGTNGTRAEVVATYEHWLLGQPHLMAQFDRLCAVT